MDSKVYMLAVYCLRLAISRLTLSIRAVLWDPSVQVGWVMSEETKVIKAKLDSLESERIQNQSRIDQLAQKNSRLDAQIEVLRSLYSDLVKSAGQSQGAGGNGRPGATDAIRDYLQSHPGGVTRKRLMDELADVIDTTSDQPRRVVANTILNLINKDDVFELENENGQKLLYLTENKFTPEFGKEPRAIEIK